MYSRAPFSKPLAFSAASAVSISSLVLKPASLRRFCSSSSETVGVALISVELLVAGPIWSAIDFFSPPSQPATGPRNRLRATMARGTFMTGLSSGAIYAAREERVKSPT